MKTGFIDINKMFIIEGELLLDKSRNWHKVTWDREMGYILLGLDTGMIVLLTQELSGQMVIISETEPIAFDN